jgi:DNA-binding transcriptional MocR family regulator
MTPPLMAEVAMRWLDDGTGEKLMAWQRNEAKARMKIAADALAGHDIYGHEHSYQIWLTLPDPWRGETVRQQAEARGVFLLSGESFVVGRQPAPHAIRICIGSCRTQGELEQGMTIIRDILNGPGGAAPVIA